MPVPSPKIDPRFAYKDDDQVDIIDLNDDSDLETRASKGVPSVDIDIEHDDENSDWIHKKSARGAKA